MPYEDFDRLFPQGPGARQERYIAAFNGLTEICKAFITSGKSPDVQYIDPDRWLEMFERLTEEGQ